MARRIFFFAGIAGLIAFFILYCGYMDSACREIVDACDECIVLIESRDFSAAQKLAADMLQKWERESAKFEIIISNITTDHIHLTINKIEKMIKINNTELSLEYLLEMRNIFDDLPKKEHLNWGNIF